MAIQLYCIDAPKKITPPKDWEYQSNNNMILLYTRKDALINGDIDLFQYYTKFRILKAEVIGAGGDTFSPDVYIEGIDVWGYLKGNWETMDSVKWEKYKEKY